MIKSVQNVLLLTLFGFLLLSCGQEATENEIPGDLTEAIRFLHAENRFEEAFERLREADANDPVHRELVYITHMNFALYLTYEAETVAMTERMPTALRHFRRVLEMEPGNQRVQAEIALIEGIYRQMGRDIPEGVATL